MLMNYAKWAYEFGIIDLAEKFGVNPTQEVIRRAPRKVGSYMTRKEAIRQWGRHRQVNSNKDAYIANFKLSEAFVFWETMDDNEKDNFTPEMLDLQEL